MITRNLDTAALVAATALITLALTRWHLFDVSVMALILIAVACVIGVLRAELADEDKPASSSKPLGAPVATPGHPDAAHAPGTPGHIA